MYVYSIDIANIEMQYIVNIWNFFELCSFIVKKVVTMIRLYPR